MDLDTIYAYYDVGNDRQVDEDSSPIDISRVPIIHQGTTPTLRLTLYEDEDATEATLLASATYAFSVNDDRQSAETPMARMDNGDISANPDSGDTGVLEIACDFDTQEFLDVVDAQERYVEVEGQLQMIRSGETEPARIISLKFRAYGVVDDGTQPAPSPPAS
jgi:hypothetical protein